MRISEFGFGGAALGNIKPQEKKNVKRKEKLALAPYEIFIKKLKEKEARDRRTIINKKAWALFKEQKKEMLRRMNRQRPDYKVLNKWRLKAYANEELTRSLDGLTAGKAWYLLKQCWEGYTARAVNSDIEGMRHYARGIEKYLWLLEEPAVGDFNMEDEK